jgi:hypothetical protein
MPTEDEPKVSFSANMKPFTDMVQSVKEAMGPIGKSFTELGKALTLADYSITQHQLAAAFDVPPNVLGLEPIPEPDLHFLHDYENPVAHLVSTGEPGKYTLVNGPAPDAEVKPKQLFEVSASWLAPGTKSALDQYVNAKVKAQMQAEDDAFLAQLQAKMIEPAPWSDPGSSPLEAIQKAIAHYKQHPSPVTAVGMDLALYGDAYVAKHEDGSISHVPMSNHTSGMAMDYYGKPVPGEANLEGSGDPFEYTVKKARPMSFEVLGKAQPVVVTPPKLSTWKTELGQIDQQGDVCQVSLNGVVSTALGLHAIGAQIVMTDLELAKKLIGVIPNDGPGTGICVLEQAAGGQLFTWEAGTGWIPRLPDKPLYASFPEVSTKKGGLKFSSFPQDAAVDPGDLHTGPDGAIWEFRVAGGWRVVEYPPGSTASSSQRAPYGWWCSYCGEHMLVHKGDPVACDSGGWCRPATSVEHKLAMMQA